MNLHGSNPASTSSGPSHPAKDHSEAVQITTRQPDADGGGAKDIREHSEVAAEADASGVGAQARAILATALCRETLDPERLRAFARAVVARDSLGALALRVLEGGVLRAAIELAGAVLAAEAIDGVQRPLD